MTVDTIDSSKTPRETVPSTSDDPDFAPLAARRLIVLVGSLLLGAGLGWLLLTRVFLLFPTDVQRLGVLVEALRDETPGPKIVFFGNSVIMSGIDAKQLRVELPSEPLAWNCSSPGQTLPEAYLLSQELPPSVELVVYTLPVRAGEEEEALHPQKYNTLFMFGFRPEAKTQSTLATIYDATLTDQLERSTLGQIMASRWAVRQFIDTQARLLLRPDLTLAHARRDLFHPQRYERPIARGLTERFLEGRNRSLDEKGVALAHGSIELARAIAEQGEAQGRRTFFLFPPVHPAILAEQAEAVAQVQLRAEHALGDLSGVTFLDASGVVAAQDYIDDMHPTNDGAAKLTRFVADSLRRGQVAN